MDNKKNKIRIGITQGDTNGIGLEVVLKTLAVPEMLDLCTPIVYGNPRVIAYHRKGLNLGNLQLTTIADASRAKDSMASVVECDNTDVKVDMGQPSKQAGRAAFLSLEAATRDLKDGKIDVMVTAPINKDNIHSEEFAFPGHTEYLEAAAGDGAKALMVMVCEQMRVALVTTHVPIAQVPAMLTVDLILEKLRTFAASLQRDFGCLQPRIAVLSLNPHAGENGLLGTEERDIIGPAIEQARDEGITCFGPYASDGFFGSRMYDHFDGILAMYHDQGLAPFKTVAMDSGVNFTAGLPIVRTSPDHGTGYDIAGQGIANEASMRHAIYTAIDIWRNRARWDEAHANPLGRLYVDHSKDNVVLDLTKDA